MFQFLRPSEVSLGFRVGWRKPVPAAAFSAVPAAGAAAADGDGDGDAMLMLMVMDVGCGGDG